MVRKYLHKIYRNDLNLAYSGFKGVIFDNVVDKIEDLVGYFSQVSRVLLPKDKILVSYHNPAWEPLFNIASLMGIRKKTGLQNWLEKDDMENILMLSGFGNINTYKRFFGITYITTAAKAKANRKKSRPHSVSIIIPARNEAGNIPKIIPSFPKFGRSMEVIFIEGNSNDNTWEIILKQQKLKKTGIKIIALKQPGVGKADATWLGLTRATGEVLMIYDADRTVDPNDLLKFYDALIAQNHAFVNGNRLLYPMEKDAMRTLNKIGNVVFSRLFTGILAVRFRDTLCGTKAFYKEDFKKFTKSKSDPFGDFDLIFGAIRQNLKVIDLPVRYKERVYGTTNIHRFYHGMFLVKMTIIAFIEFKLLRRKNTQ